MNPLFPKSFIHCAMVIPFILHWPSLFFSKVSNSRKKVLITAGLYFPNYCVTYLPCNISRDFKKFEHMNLRREWTCAVFEELYYAANNQKIADKKKADYQKGLEKVVLTVQHKAMTATWKTWRKVVHEATKVTWRIRGKNHADSAAWSCKSYKKDLEKSRDDSAARSRESYFKGTSEAILQRILLGYT